MKKKVENKTRFHDWLLINAMKNRDADAIPEGFTDGFTANKEEREAVKQDDSEGKLALLTRFAKHKYPDAGRGIEFADLLLWLSPVPVFLLLWLLFGSVTLSGVDRLENGDTGVRLGLFLGAITFQYIVILVCISLWTIYFLREVIAALLGRTAKTEPSAQISLKSLMKRFLVNPIGTIVIASHSATVSAFSIRKKEPLSFVDFARQYQKKSQALQLFAHTFAQLFWFFLALISIVLFAYSSAGGNNRFYWPNSALYPEQQLYWVQTIQLFTLVKFTEEEILELIQDDELKPNSTVPVETRNNAKVKWTWFMISALVPPLVARFILFFVIRHFFVRSQHAFKPDLKEEFYRNLIEKIDGIQVIKDVGNESTTPPTPLVPPEPSLVADPPKAAGPPKTLIFMPNLSIPMALWQDCFPDEEHREIYNAQQCRDREGRNVQERVNKGEMAVANIVFAFSLTDNPVADKMTFVKETARAFGDKTFVLLSGADDLRQQKKGNPAAVAERLLEWRNNLKRTGVLPEHIIDWFDHNIDDAVNRKRLVNFFRGNQEGFHLAGKYVQASEMILAGLRELFREFDTHPQSFASAIWDARPAVDERLLSYRNKISRLYAEEGKKLSASLGQWPVNADVDLTEIKREAGNQFGAAAEKVHQLGGESIKESIAWGHWLTGVAKSMKPRCGLALGGMVLATATTGIALTSLGPAAALIAPYVVSAFGGTGGVLGFFAPEMSKGVFQISKGVFRKKLREGSGLDMLSSATNEAEANFRVEVSTFLASLTVWAAVHELQGLPPERLTEHLSCVLEPIETADIDSLDAISNALAESRQILEKFDIEKLDI